MWDQLSLNFLQQYFQTLNAALAQYDLPAVSSVGNIGEPIFTDIHDVKSDTGGFIVRFKVLFPDDENNLPLSEGEIPLRFQKDGTLYDGASIKKEHKGRLYEGIIHATEHQWHIEWEKE